MKHNTHAYACSFCGKNKEQVTHFIAGSNGYICGECVELCNEIIAKESAAQEGNDYGSDGPDETKPERSRWRGLFHS